MNLNKFFIVVVIMLCFSCSSKKNILYMQDIDDSNVYSFNYKEYKIKVDDILKIDVNTAEEKIALQFSPKGIIQTSNKDNIIYEGYQVNLEGDINYPSLGKINVKGKTIRQIREYIYNAIISNDLLNDPIIDVKLVNSSFTALGEVNSPGRHEFLENNLNIIEAIGIAGDLTINGQRKNIKVIREIEGESYVRILDLTGSDFFNSDSFQIFSGDIIIVNPNFNRVKNAGVIGNSGTLVSLLSFILSSIIIISN